MKTNTTTGVPRKAWGSVKVMIGAMKIGETITPDDIFHRNSLQAVARKNGFLLHVMDGKLIRVK